MSRVIKSNIYISIAVVTILITSCMTTRFGQETSVKTKDHRVINHVYENSYDTSGWGWSCVLTGIFYGGTCWAYLGMPYPYQENLVAEDVKFQLDLQFGSNGYEVMRQKQVSRVGYDDLAINSTYSEIKGSPITLPLTSIVEKPSRLPATPSIPEPTPSPEVEQKPRAFAERKPEQHYKDLKNPLSIEGYSLHGLAKNSRERRYRDSVILSLELKNNGSKRITAYEIKVKLSSRLGRDIGTFTLTSESSSLASGQVEAANFSWEDNQFLENEAFDRLVGVSTENLKVKLIQQKVAKSEDLLTH